MGCRDCKKSLFKLKLGRCKTCIWQLILFSLTAWLIWFYLYFEQPYRVESIALLFFAIAFSGLLLLHLVVLAYRLFIEPTLP